MAPGTRITRLVDLGWVVDPNSLEVLGLRCVRCPAYRLRFPRCGWLRVTVVPSRTLGPTALP